MTAHDILNNPFLNKGTAFTIEERKELGLIGLLPPYVQTIEEQAAQTYAQMETKANDLEKRGSLTLVKEKNCDNRWYYRIFLSNFNTFILRTFSYCSIIFLR